MHWNFYETQNGKNQPDLNFQECLWAQWNRLRKKHENILKSVDANNITNSDLVGIEDLYFQIQSNIHNKLVFYLEI